MQSKTGFTYVLPLLLVWASPAPAQQAAKDQTPRGAPAESVPETETIPYPQPAQTPQAVNAPGYMDPAHVKALTQEISASEFRIHDLLAAVHPEKWKTSNIIRNSFSVTLENLQKTLDSLEQWRAQFEKRPDSMYFGFQTYAAINAALPRLDGVGRAVSQFENPSLGAQYSQVGDKLFDLQQGLQPYVAYLLRSPDQLLYTAQSNLAGCQNELGNALRGQTGPARPLKNTFVELHTRRRSEGQAGERKSGHDGNKDTTDKPYKKPEAQ
jgi:hypothetical protein